MSTGDDWKRLREHMDDLRSCECCGPGSCAEFVLRDVVNSAIERHGPVEEYGEVVCGQCLAPVTLDDFRPEPWPCTEIKELSRDLGVEL